jgi:hypothetical protein
VTVESDRERRRQVVVLVVVVVWIEVGGVPLLELVEVAIEGHVRTVPPPRADRPHGHEIGTHPTPACNRAPRLAGTDRRGAPNAG